MPRQRGSPPVVTACGSPLASNLLPHGAEVVTIRDFLGHRPIASSERYAKVSSQKVKQEYLRPMQTILKQGQV